MRLSWPRQNDRKRAIVLEMPSQSQRPPLSRYDLVNVYTSDVETSRKDLNPGSTTAVQIYQRLMFTVGQWLPERHSPAYDTAPIANPNWAPHATQAGLLSYCKIYHPTGTLRLNSSDQHSPTQLLTFANHSEIQHTVLRMAFTDPSFASSAILYAIYAFSSLSLSYAAQALQYKAKAIRAIQISTAQDSATKDALQRIVAANLLTLFEVVASPSFTKMFILIQFVDSCKSEYIHQLGSEYLLRKNHCHCHIPGRSDLPR
jgi:hypothetical protein